MAIAFALGTAIGYGVWAAAPLLIGHRAPWDGSWPYYSTVLIGASALVALMLPGRYAAVFVGTVIGQSLAKLILLSMDQRFWLSSQYDWIGCLLTFPGTWIGSAIRNYRRRAA